MPTLGRIVTFALALGCVVSLSGCAGGDAAPSPIPEPSATPVFASEEEALAAATEAYANYLAVSDSILAEGGADPERVEEFAIGEAARSAFEGFDAFSARGYRSTGRTTFDNLSTQQYFPHASSDEEVIVVYLCEDVSGVDVLNSDGVSVVSGDRPPKQAYEVAFARSKAVGLVLSRSITRDGAGICAMQ